MARVCNNLFLLAIVLCIAIIYVPFHALAGEDGLYADAPPPDSAFVRFVNGDAGAAETSIRSQPYHTAALGEVAFFSPIPNGETMMSCGTSKTTANLKSGSYYSVLHLNGKLNVLEEPSYDKKLKAQIVLINASNAPNVSLKTPDGKISVVGAVSAGALGARAVNGVKIGFSVYAGDKKIADIAPASLERGAAYAIVVYKGTNGKPAARFGKSEES